MKIFVHEQSLAICKYCDQFTLYRVAGLYCSDVCRDLDHQPWKKWWLKLWRFL
jgi:hypothetical protein